MFLKPLHPLFKDGIKNINWKIADEQIRDILNSFFTTIDWSAYSNENDVHFFVVIKNKETGEKLGMIQFIITPEYDYGTVKIELYDGVMPKVKDRGIEKILVSSIFKLIV